MNTDLSLDIDAASNLSREELRERLLKLPDASVRELRSAWLSEHRANMSEHIEILRIILNGRKLSTGEREAIEDEVRSLRLGIRLIDSL